MLGLSFVLAVCDGNTRDNAQEENADIVSAAPREPDPRDLLHSQASRAAHCGRGVLATCGTFVARGGDRTSRETGLSPLWTTGRTKACPCDVGRTA